MSAEKGPEDRTMIGYYTYLSGSIMQRTRGARFVASQLLVMKERGSLLILAILTIFLIAISLLLLIQPDALDAAKSRQVGVLSIVSSVTILAITIFDYALARGLLAAKLHDSSLRITEIMREMERELVKEKPSYDVLERLAASYELENKSTNVNHSNFDFFIYTLTRKRSGYFLLNIVIQIFNAFVQLLAVSLSISPGIVVLLGVFFYAYRLFG